MEGGLVEIWVEARPFCKLKHLLTLRHTTGLEEMMKRSFLAGSLDIKMTADREEWKNTPPEPGVL